MKQFTNNTFFSFFISTYCKLKTRYTIIRPRKCVLLSRRDNTDNGKRNYPKFEYTKTTK